MYVVRRTFRNYGQMIAPGSIVEPAAIKRFKSRLNDGHIVDVREQDIEKWQKYFKERLGVEIKLPEQMLNKSNESKSTHEPVKAPEHEKITKIVKPATAAVKAH